MLQSVIEEYPDTDISVNVVWVPMLESDNEAAAREMSKMFTDPRVHQFWDPDRRSGTAYSKDVYPNYVRDMIASLPPDDWLAKMMKDRGERPPENAPLWDVAFFYKAGPTWQDRPPIPVSFIKQLAFYGGQTNGKSGRFCRDDFTKPPFDTDWFVELTNCMKQLTGKEPTRKTADQSTRSGSARPSLSVASLADSLKPLKDRFNAHKDKTRFVAILSPT